MRLESVCGPKTRIHFETEGILLRQMLSQPTLPGVAAILFDEFHERHVYGDVTLAQALRLQQTTRPDLLLLVMSATLDARLLQPYLEPCTHLHSEAAPSRSRLNIWSPCPDHDPPWDAAAAAYERAARAGEAPAIRSSSCGA